jgi:hypothetical protein
MWRMVHNSLPVRANLSRRGVNLYTICPMCQRYDEDCGHLFFECKRVRACWRDMNLEQVRAELELCYSGQETTTKIWSLERDLQNKVLVFLWRWWSVRNKVNAGEKMATSGPQLRFANLLLFIQWSLIKSSILLIKLLGLLF